MKRLRVIVDCSGDKIRTKQSFKTETDINHILAKYRKTGIITADALNARQASFLNVSEIGDFQECQQVIAKAESAFMTLPALVRSRFQNDPAELLDFVKNPENRDEAILLGIIAKTAEPEPPPEPAPAPPEPPTT